MFIFDDFGIDRVRFAMQGANPIRIIIVLFIKYSQYCRIATHKKMRWMRNLSLKPSTELSKHL